MSSSDYMEICKVVLVMEFGYCPHSPRGVSHCGRLCRVEDVSDDLQYKDVSGMCRVCGGEGIEQEIQIEIIQFL